jgi:outer membrane protein assembly factor BamB
VLHRQARRNPPTPLGLVAVFLLLASVSPAGADSGEILYATEGNRLRRFDLDTLDAPPAVEDVFIERAGASANGSEAAPAGKFRDVNGMICPFPDGSGRFIAGEDTAQPAPPPGWGVFAASGKQIGKLTATYNVANAEPFGCAFDAGGLLFTTEVGTQDFSNPNGQLILWFPPYDQFPGPPGAYPNTNAASTNFCKIATDIGTATGIAIDDQGRVYVAAASQLSVFRFSPPFPTSADAAGGCGSVDALGSPRADAVNREVFIAPSGLSTFTGLAFAPNGNLYAAQVLTGRIGEYDAGGSLVRFILSPPESLPPISTGTPQGIAVDARGSVYYADLDLVGTLPNIGPGPNGKVWRIRFDAGGNPQAPEIVRQGLSFPDGVAVLPGNLQESDWRSYAGGEKRLFFNPREAGLSAGNAGGLGVKWTFPTGAIVTASPSVARVAVPGEGRIRVAYIQSWDANVYALRLRDGSELWRFATEARDGVSFPNTASVHVEQVNGAERVFVGSGQTFYALDAATGTEIWRFDAGTGCVVPGACGFAGERNEIESSALVADGRVFFGMDVNDREGGKGGFYALDVADGRLVWFFDLESGSTCRPDPSDNVRRYDGYHSEAELGLAADFFATRPGCNHPRTPNGCGNIWSSPAYDAKRGFLYFASSNCDTDSNPATLRPEPPMPPFDEAVVALDLDGNPVWRWRPREVDNGDLAFGAAPNLFTAIINGQERDVLGVGNKDGTYYVLDRDGVNEINGRRWDDASPDDLPYWRTNVVPGGAAGGVLATAAVDDANDRIYFSTAPGSFDDVLNPQRPTVHALDAGSGAILWQNTAEANADASFAPTSAVPGLVFAGSVLGGFVRVYDVATGDRLARVSVGFALAGAPAIVDGLVLAGAGIGTRSGNPADPSEITSRTPQNVTGLCAPGTAACALDVPIAGRKLRVIEHASRPAARHLTVEGRDAAIVAPGAAAPTSTGATLEILNPFTGKRQEIPLPASGWRRFGRSPGAESYRYRDRNAALGPCLRATLENGRFKAKCRGSGISFRLDEAAQGVLAIALSVGTDRVYCMRFGGNVGADQGLAAGPRGRFHATAAPAPERCPLP